MNTPTVTTTTATIKGVVCPKCNGRLKTGKTTHQVDRSTRRYKLCRDPKCGYRGYSCERLTPAGPPAVHI